MTSADGRKLIVNAARKTCCRAVVAAVDVGRGYGEDAEALVGLLHEGEVGLLAPRRRGETVLSHGVNAQLAERVKVGLGQRMRVNVNAWNHGLLRPSPLWNQCRGICAMPFQTKKARRDVRRATPGSEA